MYSFCRSEAPADAKRTNGEAYSPFAQAAFKILKKRKTPLALEKQKAKHLPTAQ
jgi:hypothetical protein